MNETSREYPSLPIPGVAAVVFHEGNVLVTKRGNEPAKGKWGIPGGIVEVGEKAEDAIVREVYEETGIKIRPEKVLTVFDSITRDSENCIRYHYVLIEYLCSYQGGEPKAGSDASDVKWIPINKIPSADIMERTRRFLIKVGNEQGLDTFKDE